MFRAVLISAFLVVATMPCSAEPIRVITGDIEHLYGRGAELLDNVDLQTRNQRAWERRQAEIHISIERELAAIQIKSFRLQEALVAAGIGYWPR